MHSFPKPTGCNTPLLKSRPPKYCPYRDGARVTIDGRTHYLPGKFNSDESLKEYRRRIAAWASGVTEDTPEDEKPDTTVAEVLEAYRRHAQSYCGESPSGRYRLMLPTIHIVREIIADLPAREFSPKKLKVVRQAFIDAGYPRGHVNQCMHRVVAMFKWAASEELEDGSLVHALESVQPLRYGHAKAPEGREVESVDQAVVDATLPHLVPVLQDMIRLLLIIGCRPGELCRMTPGQIDRGGDVWFYGPEVFELAEEWVPFDRSNPAERELRLLPGNLRWMRHRHYAYVGRQDGGVLGGASAARSEMSGGSSLLEIIVLPGDHFSSHPIAMQKYLELIMSHP